MQLTNLCIFGMAIIEQKDNKNKKKTSTTNYDHPGFLAFMRIELMIVGCEKNQLYTKSNKSTTTPREEWYVDVCNKIMLSRQRRNLAKPSERSLMIVIKHTGR